MRSGAGPFASGFGSGISVGLLAGSLCPPLLLLGFSLLNSSRDSLTPLEAMFLPFFLASCCARYWRRLISKSGSLRYSSKEAVKLVGACFNFGISNRVAFWYCLATPKNSTTLLVCLLKVLYIAKALSASYLDISK